MKEIILSREAYLEHNNLVKQIIGAAIEVHREIGPGLLTEAYEYCLKIELERRGMRVETHIDQPLYYKGRDTGKFFTLDMLVENKIIVDLKAVDEITPIHESQMVSYLRLTQKAIGLIINFNVALLKDGVKRKMNAKVEDENDSTNS